MVRSAVINTPKLISLSYIIFLLLTAPPNRLERQHQKDKPHWNLDQDRMRSVPQKSNFWVDACSSGKV